MKNEFPLKPSFYIGTLVPPQFLIARTREIKDSIKTLLERQENVLVVGKRRIGKSSFINKLRYELEEREKILTIEVNLMTYDSDPSRFLREILLLLCYKVGEKIFNKSTIDLLASIGEKPSSIKGDFGNFYKIYKLVRFLSTTKTQSSSIGASLQAPVIGSVSAGKHKETSSNIDTLQPFEFIQLTEELMKICRKAGYKSAIVFADESNRLALDTSKELLASYFDIFSSRNVLFVFTADVNIIDYKLIEDIFGETIRLNPFDSTDDVIELLDRYYGLLDKKGTDGFSKDSVSYIWKITNGHPYLIQLLCSNSIDIAQHTRHNRVEKKDVTQAWYELIEKDQRLVELAR